MESLKRFGFISYKNHKLKEGSPLWNMKRYIEDLEGLIDELPLTSDTCDIILYTKVYKDKYETI